MEAKGLESDGKAKCFESTAAAGPKISEKEKLAMERERDGVESELATSAMDYSLPSISPSVLYASSSSMLDESDLESDEKTKLFEPTATSGPKKSEKEKLEMGREKDGGKLELATSTMDCTLPSISPSVFSASSSSMLDESDLESDEKTKLFEPTATSGTKKSEKEKLEMGREKDGDKTELDTSAMNSSHPSTPPSCLSSSSSSMLELESDGKIKWFEPTATAVPKKSKKEKLEMGHEEDGDKTELVTSSMVFSFPSKTSCTSNDLPTLKARLTSAAVLKQSERKHITELLTEVRAAENPYIFHANDDSSGEIDELEALRREEQALIKEASSLQIQKTKQAARHAAQLAVLQGEVESNHKTAKNSSERKKSVLKKIRDQKKQRQTLETEIKEGVERMDIPKCCLKTFVKLSDDAVCTDKEFCDVLSGKCFPTAGPESKDTTK